MLSSFAEKTEKKISFDDDGWLYYSKLQHFDSFGLANLLCCIRFFWCFNAIFKICSLPYCQLSYIYASPVTTSTVNYRLPNYYHWPILCRPPSVSRWTDCRRRISPMTIQGGQSWKKNWLSYVSVQIISTVINKRTFFNVSMINPPFFENITLTRSIFYLWCNSHHTCANPHDITDKQKSFSQNPFWCFFAVSCGTVLPFYECMRCSMKDKRSGPLSFREQSSDIHNDKTIQVGR